MTRTHLTIIALALGAGLFFLGRGTAGGGHAGPGEQQRGEALETAAKAAAPTLWTCPMHAQIRLPDAGDCPICGMDLTKMTPGDSDPRRLAMSPAARDIARIRAQTVRRANVSRPVRMTGKVDYDETAVQTISAWVGGRLDRLYVDYTGVRVTAGDHLVRLYSPELLIAQQELLSSLKRRGAAGSEASEFLRDSSERAYTSTREKLRLWGLTDAQVDEIESRGSAEDHVMLTSPTSGVVIDKFLDQGAYVQTGTPIYRVADLTDLWVLLDAYEQDLAWLRHGQPVVLEVEALPGETFEGRIAYIDPFIHEHSRTAKVRVNIDNADGRLKPGMFVTGVAMSRLGAGGQVLDQYLAGKWVSPMHPEVVKDGPGVCDICGMDLVPAEDLGLVSRVAPSGERPIVVPSSAVLVTGKRAVVYVEVPGADRPTYQGREVVLGPRAGDEYIVADGLREGERVVVNGAFRIDSSMQIKAKPSMMGMPGEREVLPGPEGAAFRASLAPLYQGYLALQAALAGDDEQASRAALEALVAALEGPAAAGLPAEQRAVWREDRSLLRRSSTAAGEAGDIEGMRVAFEDLSRATLSLARTFGQGAGESLVEAYCPMAFDDKGAAWLQVGEEILNPYFGASMLRCGEVREIFPSTGAKAAPEDRSLGAHADEHAGHAHGATGVSGATTSLGGVFAAYVDLQVLLAGDDASGAAGAARVLLRAVVTATEDESTAAASMGLLRGMHGDLIGIESDGDIEAIRTAFRSLSERIIAIERIAGNPLTDDLEVVHCPMAFEDTGADWIQLGDTIANPYFGASMLRCGAIQRTAPAGDR